MNRGEFELWLVRWKNQIRIEALEKIEEGRELTPLEKLHLFGVTVKSGINCVYGNSNVS